MRGNRTPPMKDPHVAVAALDLDRLTDERERHRVAVGVEADKEILSNDAAKACLESKARSSGTGQQVCAFLGETIER